MNQFGAAETENKAAIRKFKYTKCGICNKIIKNQSFSHHVQKEHPELFKTQIGEEMMKKSTHNKSILFCPAHKPPASVKCVSYGNKPFLSKHKTCIPKLKSHRLVGRGLKDLKDAFSRLIPEDTNDDDDLIDLIGDYDVDLDNNSSPATPRQSYDMPQTSQQTAPPAPPVEVIDLTSYPMTSVPFQDPTIPEFSIASIEDLFGSYDGYNDVMQQAVEDENEMNIMDPPVNVHSMLNMLNSDNIYDNDGQVLSQALFIGEPQIGPI